jgi:hypothetical protein
VKPLLSSLLAFFLFQTLRCNCDMLKLIQLGLSFTDEKGNFAEGCSCWQFNFKFSLDSDMFAQDSIDLLKASGIDFQKFATCGIDVSQFGELMMMSGLILSDDVKWVSFHSGYDFGYLLKTLSCEELPSEESAFLEQLYTYFPCVFDIKVGASALLPPSTWLYSPLVASLFSSFLISMACALEFVFLSLYDLFINLLCVCVLCLSFFFILVSFSLSLSLCLPLFVSTSRSS